MVPALEELAAQASPVSGLGVRIVPWQESEDAVALVSSLLGGNTAITIALDDHMWAEKVLMLRVAMPHAHQVVAGPLLQQLRMRKSTVEVQALRSAGEAIDRVHARMAEWLRVGRTEREVSRDIGGTTETGYCSDETRTYCLGDPPVDVMDYYSVLLRAQLAACEHARPGVTAESVDAVGRDLITAAGYGEAFLHRTGHGIGLETHEEPYIVAGNSTVLEPGMAFSIEPGIYLPGRHGARIEDIVVVTDDGCARLNQRPRDLAVLPA